MPAAALAPNEAARLEALARYGLMEAGQQGLFEDLTALTVSLLALPIALVSLVGEENQCFVGRAGLDATGTPRSVAFCATPSSRPGRPWWSPTPRPTRASPTTRW